MSGKDEVQSNELQRLISDGMTLVCAENNANSPSSQPEPLAVVDITDDFFMECKKLNDGELVMADDFQLSEAMSAIELMDPKMDIGMKPFDPSIAFESLIATGRLNITNMDEREMIATMDAMLASLISWLEGNSIAQTLLTCVFLNHMDSVTDSVLSAFSYGVLELTTVFRHIIQMASVYEEDPYIKIVSPEPYKLKVVQQPFISSKAKSVRCEYLKLTLLIIRNFNSRYHATPAMDEDFNGYAAQFHLLPIPKLTSSLKAAEIDLQRRIKQKPANQELLDAVLYRIQFIRFMLLSLSLLVQSPTNSCSRSNSCNCFRPNLEECALHLNIVCLLLDKMESTMSLGLQPLEKDDEDYAWLPAFEPDINRRQLPPTFPRITKMINRAETMRYLKKLCSKISSITTELPAKVSNIEDIIDYLRTFSLADSCVLTRSLLQMVLFPSDDNILGRVQLSTVIVDSIRMFAAPPVLDSVSQAFSVEQCRECWEEFVNDSVKVFLGVIQMFGLNPARQREKIVCCIEDFSTLQAEAERAENAFDLYYFGQEATINLSLTSFVMLHTLSLIKYHFFLSFYLDLFASFEYSYVYWYLSEIVFKWLVNTLDRSVTLVAAGEKRMSKVRKKSDRKKLAKCKKEIEMKKKAVEKQRFLLFYRAQAKVAEAFFMAAVALIAAGKIRMPLSNTEQSRFEHRMSPFSSLNSVTFRIALFVEYAQYIHISRVESLRALGGAKCFSIAADAFDWARGELESLSGNDEIAQEAAAIARICKNNAVVSRIISSGSKNESQIGFVFNGDSSYMYPLLKIT
uniref:Protein MAK10 homolog n=1 Tax=Loa loa TaxID=7209 RepID=A0A1I7VXJ2_LOALO